MANFTSVTSHKNKDTALLLCIFGGVFGLHQFYVGRIGKGLLYFCTGGLFMIGWFIDILKILLGSYTDKYGMPLIASRKDYKNKNKNIAIPNGQNVNVNVNMPNGLSEKHIDITEQLKKLADLRDTGVLTEEEFNSQKSRILANNI